MLVLVAEEGKMIGARDSLFSDVPSFPQRQDVGFPSHIQVLRYLFLK